MKWQVHEMGGTKKFDCALKNTNPVQSSTKLTAQCSIKKANLNREQKSTKCFILNFVSDTGIAQETKTAKKNKEQK